MSLWAPLPLEHCYKLGLRLPIQGQYDFIIAANSWQSASSSPSLCLFLHLRMSPCHSFKEFWTFSLSLLFSFPTSSESFVNFVDFNEDLGPLFRNSIARYKTAFLHSAPCSQIFHFLFSFLSVCVFFLLLRTNSSFSVSSSSVSPTLRFYYLSFNPSKVIAVYS